jgi:hypothetical protein
MPKTASLQYRSNIRTRHYPAVSISLLTSSPVLGSASPITLNFSLVWRGLPANTDITFASSDTAVSDAPVTYNIGATTNGSTTRTFVIKPDANAYRGPKTLRLQALINGVVYATSNEITALDAVATYAITPSILTVNETVNINFSITTTNVPDGTVLYWTNSGSSSAADFSQGINSGPMIIVNNTASMFLTPRPDLITEGAETVILELRSDSITGTVLATASTVNIADTSVSPVSITGITPTAYIGDTGQSFTISGIQFVSGAVVYFRTRTGVDHALITTFVNSTTLTAVTTRNFLVAEAPLSVRVVQAFNEAQLNNAVTCGSSPTWTTTAGNIGAPIYDRASNRSFTANVSAFDPDGGTVTYSIVGTGFPANTSINASTGVITSLPARVASDTLYTFTVRATDPQGNPSDRQFTIVVFGPKTVVYSFTGGDQSFTVPTGITRVEFRLWGAGGTCRTNDPSGPQVGGGDGGFTQSIISTTGGTTFTLIVGQSTYNRGNSVNYGGGRGSYTDGNMGGGDGGGRSAVRLGGTEILTAGGGGGGGTYAWTTGQQPFSSPGGTGGGLVAGGGGGYAWTAAGDGTTAGGGSQTAGGVGGRHQGPPPFGPASGFTLRFAPGGGTQFTGGPTASGYAGGGGGGGYYGGGGGIGEHNVHWGGGGGSGWAGRNGASILPGSSYGSVSNPEDTNGRTDTVTNITYYNTVVIQGRNSGDAYYGNNAGVGGVNSAIGGHGRIVVIY